MKTEQEQTKQMLKILCDKFQCSAIDISYMAKSCKQCEDIVEALHEAGYGNISEYKAEREMLGSQIKVLKQRLNDKYIEVDNLNRDYRNAFERLKAQEREIAKLKAENKQAQIDILNKANERLNVVSRELGDDCDLCGVSAVCSCRREINELIKEVENGKDKG